MSHFLWTYVLQQGVLPCPSLFLEFAQTPLALNLPSIRVFSNESAFRIRWPKYWSFRFSISPCNDYSGMISFKTDLFDLLAVQETLKSLLQHHSWLIALILQHSALFMIQLSHLYRTTGKTIALTRQTFVSKVMSLLFNMLSSFVIVFLWRSKCLLISWLQSPSTVIFGAQENKVCHCFNFPHLFAMKWWDQVPCF